MKIRTYHNPVGVSKFTGLALISPFIIGAVLFIIYPFVCSFISGLTDSSGSVETENFSRLITDNDFKQSVGVTFRYTAVLVPLKLIISQEWM